MRIELIEVTFYKDTKVDSKLYKKGTTAKIPANAAKVYEGKRLNIGKPKLKTKKHESKTINKPSSKKPSTKSRGGSGATKRKS